MPAASVFVTRYLIISFILYLFYTNNNNNIGKNGQKKLTKVIAKYVSLISFINKI